MNDTQRHQLFGFWGSSVVLAKIGIDGSAWIPALARMASMAVIPPQSNLETMRA